MKEKNIKREKPKLLPSHFYEENGRTVFTEEYHIERGYCCGNGCRHCVYDPKYVKGNTNIKKGN
jgi:hypothetical protein